MEITRITDINKKAFEGFFPKSELSSDPNLIRIGVVDDEGVAAGALCASILKSNTTILSIYVVPKWRRHGYASAMIGTLQEIVSGLEFDTLTTTFLEDDTNASFFNAQGFELFPGRMQYSFTLGELKRSPLLKKYIIERKISPAPAISQIDPARKKIVDDRVKDLGYDPELSTAHFVSGQLHSILLATSYNETISIVWMESVSGSPTDLLHNMSGLLKLTLEKFKHHNDVTYRMIFNDDKLATNIAAMTGGMSHLHCDGRLLFGVKVGAQ